VSKLAEYYGIGIQTICEIKNNKMKLMEFVRDCDSGAGPSNGKSMKKSSDEEVDVALLQCSTRSEQREHQSLVLCVHRKPKFFRKALGLEGEFRDGCSDSSKDTES
jgi:hypothetical protein